MTVRLGDSRASRGAMWAWAAAGVLWALVWFHGTQTHGFTAENERRLWLGATWMDSSKLLCIPFAVVAVGLYLLGRDARIGRVSRWLWVLLVLATAVQAVAVLVGYSPFPWGSYELTFEELAESDRYPAVVSMGVALVGCSGSGDRDAVHLLHIAGVLGPGGGLVPRLSRCGAEPALRAWSPAGRSGVRQQFPT